MSKIYNGHQKIFTDIRQTIEECDILECVKELKIKIARYQREFNNLKEDWRYEMELLKLNYA